MHPHIKALKAVLASHGVSASAIAGFPDSLMTSFGVFMYAATPFNQESVAALCHDKAATHAILGGKTTMPRTRAFLDPNGPRPEFCTEKSVEDIVRSAADFPYPRMVKMNRGERGKNVYFIENEKECLDAFRAIFDKGSAHYDFVALVQEYVPIKREIRVAVSAGEPSLIYDRVNFQTIEGQPRERTMLEAKTIARTLGLSWGALDFIESTDGATFFIEANTRPNYEGFIKAHGDAPIRELFDRAISHIKNESLEGFHEIVSTSVSS